MRLAVVSFASLVVLVCIGPAFAMQNGLARTPPMGWDPYNYSGFRFSEAAIKSQADAMVRKGMKDAGYVYMMWGGYQGEDKNHAWRAADSTLAIASARLNLMPYLHERGLKSMEYLNPWMVQFHEAADAAQIIDAGFDLVFMDNIYVSIGGLPMALNFCNAVKDIYAKTGKAIVIGTNTDLGVLPASLTNIQRVAADLGKSWAGIVGNINVIGNNTQGTQGAGPGFWNYLDILWVGSMAHQDEISMFSMWSMVASPLFASLDVANMSPDDSAILLNREVIAIDQDSLGVPAKVVKTANGMQIWARPLLDGSKAVALSNPTEAAGQMTVNWTDVGYPAATKVQARDLWKHQDLGELDGSYSSQVPAHGVVVLKVKGPGSVGVKQPGQRRSLRGPSKTGAVRSVSSRHAGASAIYTPQGKRDELPAGPAPMKVRITVDR